jgi:hypothetical protein
MSALPAGSEALLQFEVEQRGHLPDVPFSSDVDLSFRQWPEVEHREPMVFFEANANHLELGHLDRQDLVEVLKEQRHGF